MSRAEWDGNFYVDETVDYINAPNSCKGPVTVLGAGLGIKHDTIELLNWCGIAYCSGDKDKAKNNKNGNGYWDILAKKCLELIVNECANRRPNKIYICNQIAFYVMQAIASNGMSTSNRKFLSKSIHPVIQSMCVENNNGVYRTNDCYKAKQKVGKILRKEIMVDISPANMRKILEGRIFDIKCNTLLDAP